ncbi:hypothetical protein AX27061_3898 [Achromobacter xylosoxidans NBRC 15126 = ATCC 27061]|nr:hypothetical protein AX27061_3898 [Achromobacter xylosoxidans NBRC 15126 = ATCC 27061]CCH09582.1 hypothetical protein NH44784_056401 [Achromobacter xylosoxidans NH44784-1996]
MQSRKKPQHACLPVRHHGTGRPCRGPWPHGSAADCHQQ